LHAATACELHATDQVQRDTSSAGKSITGISMGEAVACGQGPTTKAVRGHLPEVARSRWQRAPNAYGKSYARRRSEAIQQADATQM